MKSDKAFRKSVLGGFNTRDVVEYLAQLSKDRREETEALRAGADRLRRERDAALDEKKKAAHPHKLSAAQAEEAIASLIAERDRLLSDVESLRNELEASRIAAVMPDTNSPEGEREELSIRYYEMRGERDALQAKYDALLAEREEERAAIECFQEERKAFESDRDAVLEALTRREQEKAELANERILWLSERTDLLNERQALLNEREGFAKRLDELTSEIERLNAETAELSEGKQARASAESVRQETARLVAETRARFNEMMVGGRSSALEIVFELDRIRAFFAHFSDRFAEMEQGIARLESNPVPHVREFVPVSFENAETDS